MPDIDPMTDAEVAAALAPVSETQLTVADFPDGPRTLTIKGLKKVDEPRQKWAIHFREAPLPWRPGVVQRRVIHDLWGKPRPDWVGRQLVLYVDPTVTLGPEKTGGIRIKQASNISGVKTGKVSSGRSRKESYRVEPIGAPPAPPPITLPTWATEGETPLTDEQLGEVVAFLVERRTPIEKVESAMGARDTWTAATVRGIYGRFQAGGSK